MDLRYIWWEYRTLKSHKSKGHAAKSKRTYFRIFWCLNYHTTVPFHFRLYVVKGMKSAFSAPLEIGSSSSLHCPVCHGWGTVCNAWTVEFYCTAQRVFAWSSRSLALNTSDTYDWIYGIDFVTRMYRYDSAAATVIRTAVRYNCRLFEVGHGNAFESVFLMADHNHLWTHTEWSEWSASW
jgi:hypothetical protein